MTIISRVCECGPKALKDGARCAKCGKPLPRKHRPRPPMPITAPAFPPVIAPTTTLPDK